MKLKQYLQEQGKKIDDALSYYLPTATSAPGEIHEAMRYSCLGGGKRLRAILAMESCRAVGGQADSVLGYACALEMIHAYSLIHDDLPCMDDDDFRRGKPTNHKVYGEAMAVLAGDALLTHAFKLIAELSLEPKLIVSLIREIATACGSQGLIGGQVVDLLSEGQSIDRDALNYIHHNKTGKLFLAALRGGALIGNASEQQLALITEYGENFGLAFQITDDILDIVGDTKKLGKEVGSDARQQKSTYPSVYGLEKAEAMASECIALCLEVTKGLPHQVWVLDELARFILQRDH